MRLTKPAKLQPPKLQQFKKLVGWQRQTTDHVPVMYLITKTFRLAMYVMTCPAFPFTILGTVVNKKARYTLRRQVQLQEQLVHRWGRQRQAHCGSHAAGSLVQRVRSLAQSAAAWHMLLSAQQLQWVACHAAEMCTVHCACGQPTQADPAPVPAMATASWLSVPAAPAECAHAPHSSRMVPVHLQQVLLHCCTHSPLRHTTCHLSRP